MLRLKPRPDITGGAPVTFLIAGLGNPGAQYDGTRHNVGFLALDLLAERHGIRVNRLKFQGLYGQGQIGPARVILLKPQTFMNLSGRSIRECGGFYRTPMSRTIVLYDDAALEVGRLRVRDRGSAGGHNGIKDILVQCATDQFPRVKIGVGAPPHPEYDMADWVLGRFEPGDHPTVLEASKRACDAVECILREGVGAAQNKFNGN